jgi:hypothetical protein
MAALRRRLDILVSLLEARDPSVEATGFDNAGGPPSWLPPGKTVGTSHILQARPGPGSRRCASRRMRHPAVYE